MKRIIAVLLALLMLAALAGCSAAPAEEAKATVAPAAEATGDVSATETNEEKSYKIGIIQLTEHVALDNACKGFIDALAEKGYVEGENLTIDFQNAQNDQSNLSTIGDRFVS